MSERVIAEPVARQLGNGGKQIAPTVAYAVISVALIKPDSLSYIGLEWLDLLLMGVDVVVLLFLIGAFLAGRLRISPVTIAVILYFLAFVPATLLGSQNFGLFSRMAGPAIAACMLTDFAVPRHPKNFLKGMSWGLLSVYSANLVSIFAFYPEGMYSTDRVSGDLYLMGFDNGMIYGLLPLVVYAMVGSLIKSGRLTTPVALLAVAVMVTSVGYVTAVSGIVGASCFLLLLGGFVAVGLGRGFILAMFFGWMLTAVLIVLTRHQEVIPVSFTALFDKDESLTGRTDLWDYALEQAAKHPFLGVGLGEWVPGRAGHFYPHPHSLAVDALYAGGLLGILALTLVVVSVVRAALNQPNSRIQYVIVSGVLSLLIVEIANSAQFKALFWALLALLAYGERLARVAPDPFAQGGLAGRGMGVLRRDEEITNWRP